MREGSAAGAAQVLESSGLFCSGPGTSLSLWGCGCCQELWEPRGAQWPQQSRESSLALTTRVHSTNMMQLAPPWNVFPIPCKGRTGITQGCSHGTACQC